jgi:hypothetical protein
MGQTTQASGTATLSNGQSQALTSAWQSDAPGVATVTDAGLLTGVGNGRATIYVMNGGRQGHPADPIYTYPFYAFMEGVFDL